MKISAAAIADLEQSLIPQGSPPQGELKTGCLLHIGATLLTAWLPGVFMGEVCRLLPDGALAEVVGIDGPKALLSPFISTAGLYCGQRVQPLARRHLVPVGDDLLGRVVDGMGRVLDEGPELHGPWRNYDASPPSPLVRQLIDRPMLTGIRAIDSLLTCGEGQRMGIFAAAGVGKSTLMSMLCRSPDSEINVLVLIGERGREVREFIEQTLGEAVRRRCVMVVSTSDRPALERMRALFVATTIAEAFRDRGKRVLLFADSLTRYARAAREIALGSGEVAAPGGYPPCVFAALPRLLERTGKGERGSITAFYTVLVEGDDMNEPLADEVRSLLDGHIVLSRRLAESAHFPAIDVLASLSRVMPMVTSAEHRTLANALRNLLAVYREVELLVRVGEFTRGEDPQADRAVDAYPAICRFLQQQGDESCVLDEQLKQLRHLTSG
ncbi:EscN/YscN/HrcN family type III secretion system ATPase [Lonsdalea quercina]|uniref:EscN/YscN/HrcN family type III secretion system ATPase n=1 Tax=Lonsdalea quercina TaxID=71657 RepID=UPI000559D30F|nr:EscN/YscN/HrcN family type III secretion system ATPase [Lonsdalea quercina]